jgi:MerR family mercuric resistance operon transcriptional regulator
MLSVIAALLLVEVGSTCYSP